MSRIGSWPINIPSGVTVSQTGNHLEVSGPKGNASIKIVPEIKIEIQDNKIMLQRVDDQKKTRALHGLTRSLIANTMIGLTEGWSKSLELVGVGFRAQSSIDKLTLNVGYSHPVEVMAPPGVTFEVLDNTKIKVLGTDKQLVGQVAANLKKVRVPDVYKGKGIRYEGEYIRKKVGKSGKTGALAGKV